MPATAKYASGSEAWGLCQKCGLRFLLHELVLDDYFPGLRVCESCYDTRQPQEFPISVGDPQALYRPSPEWQATPSLLIGYGLYSSIVIFWSETAPQGGPRVDQYDVYRSDSTDGIFFSDPVRLIAFPVDYYADYGANSLADLVDYGSPPHPNHGISNEVLTYEDEGVIRTGFYKYKIIAHLNGGRLVASNTIEVATSNWHAMDAMHTVVGMPSGTLIYGVHFTSRPYPVDVVETMHTGNIRPLKGEAFFNPPDMMNAGNPMLTAGSIHSVVIDYTYWPLTTNPDERYHAGNPLLTSGTFDSVVVNYTYWPLTVAPDEQYHAGNPLLNSGTLAVGLIQYQHWPLRQADENIHAGNPLLTAGTLA